MNWTPINKPTPIDDTLACYLRAFLGRRLDDGLVVDIVSNKTLYGYLTGLRDAKIQGADELLEALEECGEVRIVDGP